jgi:hypothetical protein
LIAVRRLRRHRVAVGFAFAGGDTSQGRRSKRVQAIGGRTAARSATPGAPSAPRWPTTPEARRKQIVKSLQDQERQQKKDAPDNSQQAAPSRSQYQRRHSSGYCQRRVGPIVAR